MPSFWRGGLDNFGGAGVIFWLVDVARVGPPVHKIIVDR